MEITVLEKEIGKFCTKIFIRVGKISNFTDLLLFFLFVNDI